MPSFQSLVSGLAIVGTALAQIGGHCEPIDSHANVIANQYTLQTTGVLNGSVVILPINYTLARSIIPSQYPILKKQYQQWLPNLPADQYPAMLQMELAHDVYKQGKAAGAGADYNRAAISFPFVDRLNDGYTAMTYNHEVIISSPNKKVQSQLTKYGEVVAPGYFAACNAYEYENGTANLALPPAKRGIDQAAWANTNTDLSNPDIAYRLNPVSSSPYGINFWYNVTNQPLFSDKTETCDKFVRLYNTAVTEAPYPYVNVQGDAAILKPFFTPKAKTVWQGAYGLKLAVSFHQQNNVQCSTLKGYHVNEHK